MLNPLLYSSLPYSMKEFDPIVLMASIPHMLAVANKVPVTNVKELIALAKAKPDTITFGTTGPGTIQRIATEYFAGIAGIKLVHVPYKGANETTTAILAGEIDMTINGMSNILPHIGEGKLKALAVSTVTRNPLAPDVPTMQEAGVPGYSSQGAFGLFAPAGTPKDIIAQDPRRHRRGAGAARREEGAGGAQLRDRRRGSGRIREIHRRRKRQMAEGDQRSQYQDQLSGGLSLRAALAEQRCQTNTSAAPPSQRDHEPAGEEHQLRDRHRRSVIPASEEPHHVSRNRTSRYQARPGSRIRGRRRQGRAIFQARQGLQGHVAAALGREAVAATGCS